MQTDQHVAQDRFALLRGEFHALVALSLSAREQRLADLASSDPALHGELGGLLAALDEADLAPTVERDLRGQRFGPFRIEAEIGRGGMGVVYRAQRVDGAFDQWVALKLLPAGSRSRELLQRFLRERQILARLNHPAIARLLDGGVAEDGRQWLAMEYVDGVDLLRACEQRGASLDQRVALLIEICAAVAYAHSRLIVHRDIKPANILIDVDGHPRLLDFGIARLDDDTDRPGTLTATRALTPRYAAPEQLAGERVTTAADVYALGVVLRELIEAAPPAARQAELQRVVAQAVAIDRDARYASVAMLADDLADWRADLPLRSGIGSARARLSNVLREYRWPLISVAAVILALSIGALLTWQQALIANRESITAQANLDALLDVLSAASPEVYAGREPRASEFLIEAARRLTVTREDPLLIWRSHTQIGAGLINLGYFADAERLLQRALTALDRLQPRDLQRELDTLRLLSLAQRGYADAAAVRTVGDRIALTAAQPGAPVDAAISALASAASTLSRLGETPTAMLWLEQAESLRRQEPNVAPGALENYWRQRGWTALRGLHLEMAQAALAESLSVMDANPSQFSALRRAEALSLLAEVALLVADGESASGFLAAAQPAIKSEYGSDNSERAALAILQARALLLTGQADGALSLTDYALPILLAAERKEPGGLRLEELRVANAVRGQAQASSGDCSAARKSTGSATPAMLGNRQRAWEIAATAVERVCGE